MFPLTAALILAASGTLAAPTEHQQVVEREFRLYRIQVYGTYRTARSEYDRRCLAGQAAYDAWQKAGASPQQAGELVMWYRGAKTASLAHVNRPLPALPQFPAPAPAAIVAAPPPTPARVPSASVSRRAAAVERFHVRQLPEGIPQQPVAFAAAQPAAPKPDRTSARPEPSWKSVSAALYKGMVFGASRAVVK